MREIPQGPKRTSTQGSGHNGTDASLMMRKYEVGKVPYCLVLGMHPGHENKNSHWDPTRKFALESSQAQLFIDGYSQLASYIRISFPSTSTGRLNPPAVALKVVSSSQLVEISPNSSLLSALSFITSSCTSTLLLQRNEISTVVGFEVVKGGLVVFDDRDESGGWNVVEVGGKVESGLKLVVDVVLGVVGVVCFAEICEGIIEAAAAG